MMYIVNLVAFVSLLIMLWRGARLFSVQGGKIFFDPAAFFLAGYLLIVLVPHMFIYNLSMFATHNVTFGQGQTATTMLTACLFGVIWSIVVTVARPSVVQQRATFERAAAFPEKPATKLMAVALMLAVAFALQIFLFGISGPVGGHMLLGILKGDLSGFYSQYNELRYAVTTQPFLEAGVRGLGTLTSIMENVANGALVLGFYLSKGFRPGPKTLIRGLLIFLTLYIAQTTGTRTALIYYAIYLTIVIMIINQKNHLKNALQAAVVVLVFLTVFTALTPKSELETGYNPFLAVVSRFTGNAANDATIIESQESGEFTFRSSFLRHSDDFEPLDRQLTYYYTQDPDLPWYETPTCLAGYFVAGGFLSVALNAMVTALVCRFFTFFTNTQRDPAVLSALFAAACIINLQMPVTGWLSIAPIIGVLVAFLFLKAISVINRNPDPGRLQPIPETLAPAH